jgi:heat shock protein HslJ
MYVRVVAIALLPLSLAVAGCAATEQAGAPSSEPAKPSVQLLETYWKLVELNGQPVPKLEREPHLILKSEGGRVTGFGGCNGFGGTYTLDTATSRVRFSEMISTMMACADGMELEQGFLKVLATADNYSLSGDRLSLNKARMAPLARFEAVHLR